MKRVLKITALVAGGIVLLGGCFIGVAILRELHDDGFRKTTIYPDRTGTAPADTVFTVNGVSFKMIGIKGGKIDCKGLQQTVELSDFYISETEVTQELWTAIMGHNPSANATGDSLPVENVDLMEALTFVNRLDSISGTSFSLPDYSEWLYVAHLAKEGHGEPNFDAEAWYKGNSGNATHAVKQKAPNRLGVYDMYGNVKEWTIGGSDPLFIVAGGSFDNDTEQLVSDLREFDHCNVKSGDLGVRLVYHPSIKK